MFKRKYSGELLRTDSAPPAYCVAINHISTGTLPCYAFHLITLSFVGYLWVKLLRFLSLIKEYAEGKERCPAGGGDDRIRAYSRGLPSLWPVSTSQPLPLDTEVQIRRESQNRSHI
jgi:hypothetical protein